MNELRIFTDGGSSPNPGKGAWSIVISELEYYRGQKKRTTNNEMQLMAFRNALLYSKKYHPNKKITIVSDSKYCVEGFNKWVDNWYKKQWNKKGGIKNLELWKEVYSLKNHFRTTPEAEWVKGHSGNKLNELADELATYKE